MNTTFENKDGYKARYLDSNRETWIMNVVRTEETISFKFQSTPSAGSYPVSLYVDECITVEEDGCERMMFISPSGRTVIVYADNRLYDSKYLKTHEVA